jgi:hypothetical protein
VAIETQTKIAIISKALILLGEKPCTSLSDPRYGVTVGSNLFELHYEEEITSNEWRFSTTKRALSRLTNVPLNQYKYAFQLPPDMLVPSHVWPKTEYEIFGTELHTDKSAVDLTYRFKPNVSAWPAYFSLLMVYKLAKDMVNPITEGAASKVQIMEGKYNTQRSRSQFADAQGRPAKPIQDNPFTDVRGAR